MESIFNFRKKDVMVVYFNIGEKLLIFQNANEVV